jgi:hypothetical protein
MSPIRGPTGRVGQRRETALSRLFGFFLAVFVFGRPCAAARLAANFRPMVDRESRGTDRSPAPVAQTKTPGCPISTSARGGSLRILHSAAAHGGDALGNSPCAEERTIVYAFSCHIGEPRVYDPPVRASTGCLVESRTQSAAVTTGHISAWPLGPCWRPRKCVASRT